MGVIATLLLTTALSGVVGTGLGGLIGALLQKDSNRTVSLLLSFAGGVLTAVVGGLFIDKAGHMPVGARGFWFVILGLMDQDGVVRHALGGIVVVMLCV